MEHRIEQRNVVQILGIYFGGIVLAAIIFLIGTLSRTMQGLTVWMIVAAIIFLAACIYFIITMVKIGEDVNIMCKEDGEHLIHYGIVVLICLTVIGFIIGIFYGAYWQNKLQNRIYYMGQRHNVDIRTRGSDILIWNLLFIYTLFLGPIYAFILLINDFNKLADAYNTSNGFQNPVDSRFGQINYAKGNGAVDGNIYTLVYANGVAGDPALGGKVKLKGGDTITIGRDYQSAQFVVKDSATSRKHCSIRVSADGNRIYVTDHSSNGTYINGKQKLVKDVETPLSRGDSIVLSKSTKFTIQ